MKGAHERMYTSIPACNTVKISFSTRPMAINAMRTLVPFQLLSRLGRSLRRWRRGLPSSAHRQGRDPVCTCLGFPCHESRESLLRTIHPLLWDMHSREPCHPFLGSLDFCRV